MSYQKGDMVRVKDRDYLIAHRKESPTVNDHMLDCAGMLAEVTDIWSGGTRLNLSVDHGLWTWNVNWLDPYEASMTDEEFVAFEDMF